MYVEIEIATFSVGGLNVGILQHYLVIFPRFQATQVHLSYTFGTVALIKLNHTHSFHLLSLENLSISTCEFPFFRCAFHWPVKNAQLEKRENFL